MTSSVQEFFPISLGLLPPELLQALEPVSLEEVPERLRVLASDSGLPGYLPDLARAEWALEQLRNRPKPSTQVAEYQVNPTLILLEVKWHPLLPLLAGEPAHPKKSPRILAFWRRPGTGGLCRESAGTRDLLALKVVSEGLDPLAVAVATGEPVGVIDGALEQAADKGLLLAPPSGLRRTGDMFPLAEGIPEKFLRAEVFTLQWHITHRCDLHCRHCYDRSSRADVDLQAGIGILDQLRDFCLRNHVAGQVSFSGGNPFLHPHFLELYRAARDRNLNPAILGNPVGEDRLELLLKIARPAFYQVSLEGLRGHNDVIRGAGNFDAVLDFLERLKRKGIYSMVMLTLTRGNLEQVVELTEILRDRVDLFTYNRLAMVGEGANLESPPAQEYRKFVGEYLQAKDFNPALALKDGLINIEREARGEALFGGCTGFGCGAAFNFVSLLPDGEVHACRKFPSPIGNIHRRTLADIYASEAAHAYRRGCAECASCRLRPVCGGCLAAAYGWGVDPLKVRDPACFLPEPRDSSRKRRDHDAKSGETPGNSRRIQGFCPGR